MVSAILLIAFGVLVLSFAIRASIVKGRELRAAPAGATRVEELRAQQVASTISRYTKAGWTVIDETDRTPAKSFGFQARVTITFRKI
jgi:hypothetical protein